MWTGASSWQGCWPWPWKVTGSERKGRWAGTPSLVGRWPLQTAPIHCYYQEYTTSETSSAHSHTIHTNWMIWCLFFQCYTYNHLNTHSRPGRSSRKTLVGPTRSSLRQPQPSFYNRLGHLRSHTKCVYISEVHNCFLLILPDPLGGRHFIRREHDGGRGRSVRD